MALNLIELFNTQLAQISEATTRLRSVCENAESQLDNFRDESTMEYQNLRKKQLAKEQESQVVEKITKKL